MGHLADACRMPPFSNGTEGDAWTSAWCDYCTKDHGQEDHRSCGEGCPIIGAAYCGSDEWPEAWVPEPDDGRFFLPSRLVCLAFEPCTKAECEGDPGADERAERVAEVVAYWQANR